MLFVYWFLWPLRLVWLLVCCLYKEVYLQIFKCVSFWLHGCCWEWEGGPVNQVNHTSWVAVVTPTDRPKSVCNCCLIEVFCGVVCVVTLPFWHFCWCRGFCHRTGSIHLLFVPWHIPVRGALISYWTVVFDLFSFNYYRSFYAVNCLIYIYFVWFSCKERNVSIADDIHEHDIGSFHTLFNYFTNCNHYFGFT